MNLVELKDILEKPITGEWGEEGDKVAVIRTTNFTNEGLLDLSSLTYRDISSEKIAKKKLEKGDIIIEKSGGTPKNPVGRVVYFDEEGTFLTNNFTATLRPRGDLIYPKYLFYQLFALYQRGGTLKFQNKTTGIINLKLKQFIDSVKIPLPPLHIQKKIAQILDLADEHRQKTEALIEKYDELAQSIFLDMFGDPVVNSKNWEMNRLSELSEQIGSGTTPNGGKKVYVEEGITFFRSQNVWRNELVYDDIAYIDEKTHSSMMRSSLKNKDILMTKTGRINTENSSLGRAAIYLGEDDQANINGHVYLIRLKESILHEFILFIITTKQYRDYIRSVCVGGIDKRQINKSHLEDFPIINPPTDLQLNFVKQLKLIYLQKDLLNRELNKSTDLFKSLLQKAFKGELVSDEDLVQT